MKKKGYSFLILILMSIIIVSATDSIGRRQDAQIGEQYIISQPCASCTYINISVLTKNGMVLNNVPMVNNGSTWVYNFTPTESLRYDVNGIGDKEGNPDSFAFWFDATLSGEQTNTSIIVSDIVLLLAILGLLSFVLMKHQKVDFNAWNKKITDDNKHMGQLFVKGFVYVIFKNSFIWVYFLGWLFVLVLRDVVYRFNSVDVYTYFTLIANVYSLGLLLVGVFMIGHFATFIKKSIGILEDKNWGIGEE